jgi:hypothetical protein
MIWSGLPDVPGLVWITPWSAWHTGRPWTRQTDENTRWFGEPPGPDTSATALTVDYLPATDFRGEVSRYLGRGK